MQEKLSKIRKPHFIKQLVSNACGTVALLHATLNVADSCGGPYQDKSFLARLTKLAAEGRTPDQLGQFLNEDAELELVHANFAMQGQSRIDNATAFHFVSYINLDGNIWELDGRRSNPIHKGECTADTFGVKVAELLKGYTQMDNTTNQFSLMALAPNLGD